MACGGFVCSKYTLCALNILYMVSIKHANIIINIIIIIIIIIFTELLTHSLLQQDFTHVCELDFLCIVVFINVNLYWC